jgi:outer membrane protein TolC
VGLPLAIAGRAPALFGAEAHATLYDPFRRTDSLEAEARAEAVDGALAAARTEAARAVLVLYGRCAMDSALVESARRRVEAQEALHARVAARHREGRETDLDLSRAALEVARARQKVLEAASDLDLDRLEFSRFTGLPAGTPLVLAEDPLAALPEPSGDHVATARAADPQLRALLREEAALARSAALSERWLQPVVDAQMQYARTFKGSGYADYYLKYAENAFTVGVSVAVPVFTGGRQAERTARFRARLEALQAERTLREMDLELATRKTERALSRAVAARSLARRALGVAEEALRVAGVVEAEGRGEPGGMEKARVALAVSEAEALQADFDVFTSRVTLRAFRGELN